MVKLIFFYAFARDKLGLLFSRFIKEIAELVDTWMFLFQLSTFISVLFF